MRFTSSLCLYDHNFNRLPSAKIGYVGPLKSFHGQEDVWRAVVGNNKAEFLRGFVPLHFAHDWGWRRLAVSTVSVRCADLVRVSRPPDQAAIFDTVGIHLQGSNSSIRLIGWSAMRAKMSRK